MENNVKKFLIYNPNTEFASMFSKDTWKDQYGNIHKIEDLEELPYRDWKYRVFLNDQYHYPKIPFSTEGIYLISHPDHHNKTVYVNGTLEEAIRFLIDNKDFNNGWAEHDMGIIRKIEVVNLQK